MVATGPARGGRNPFCPTCGIELVEDRTLALPEARAHLLHRLEDRRKIRGGQAKNERLVWSRFDVRAQEVLLEASRFQRGPALAHGEVDQDRRMVTLTEEAYLRQEQCLDETTAALQRLALVAGVPDLGPDENVAGVLEGLRIIARELAGISFVTYAEEPPFGLLAIVRECMKQRRVPVEHRKLSPATEEILGARLDALPGLVRAAKGDEVLRVLEAVDRSLEDLAPPERFPCLVPAVPLGDDELVDAEVVELEAECHCARIGRSNERAGPWHQKTCRLYSELEAETVDDVATSIRLEGELAREVAIAAFDEGMRRKLELPELVDEIPEPGLELVGRRIQTPDGLRYVCISREESHGGIELKRYAWERYDQVAPSLLDPCVCPVARIEDGGEVAVVEVLETCPVHGRRSSE